MSSEKKARKPYTECGVVGKKARWFHRMSGRAQDDRGLALITTLFIVFLLGMMLFAFVFMMQSEAGLAGLNRNSTVSLGLAEAGLQEAVQRLAQFGRGPAASTFSNSLANSPQAPGSTGTVTLQTALQNNPQLFPVTSTATFGGTTRTVRLIEQMLFKPGNGNIVFAPVVSFQGNAQQTTGDSYALTSATFQQWQKAPQCSAGATPTNLVSPQVFAGTFIQINAGGPSQSTPCGDTNAAGPYNTECATATNEVAPTPCPGGRLSAGGYTVPQNWHPNTPIGMSSADFATAATWINANPVIAQATYGLTLTHAQQSAVDVVYTPAAYSPSYWPTISGSTNRVLLMNGQLPFCVAAPGNPAKDIKQPVPLYPPSCAGGYDLYGPNAAGQANRYLDWGLVQDDLSRPVPQTFFQAPSCTAPCLNPGYQNGVRYIPLVPQINVLGRACLQNVNPGTNVFDRMNVGGPTCPNPPITTISTASVTFSGTYANPESLIIDNAGLPGCPGGAGCVSITPSIPGPGSCTSNFQTYNWGMILATGDLQFASNTVFSGFVYAQGSIYTSGTSVFSGGLYANSINPNNQVNVQTLGNFSICAGSAAAVPESPLFYNFSVISWNEVPANQP